MGCLICIGHFVQKSPIISGSFAKNDLQLKVPYGCSPTCTRRTCKSLEPDNVLLMVIYLSNITESY